MNAVDVPSSILIHRAPHDAEHPYLRISQATLQDRRLSLTAQGLLVHLLSHKDTWRIEPRHLASVFNLNIETIRKLLKELASYGYVKLRQQIRDASGCIAWSDYEVYEHPNPDLITAETDATAKKARAITHTPSTRLDVTVSGSTMAGQDAPLITKKNSNKQTNDSPAEKHVPDPMASSPDGDAHAGDASQKRVVLLPIEQGRAEQLDTTRSVKAPETHLESRSSHDTRGSLPVFQDVPAVPHPRPMIDAPRAAVCAPPVAAGGEGQKGQPPTQPITHSHKPKASPGSRPDLTRHPLQAVIAHAFKLPPGAYAGKIGQFFAGNIPRRRKDLWAQHQPELPASPQEILALLLWYKQHPAYAKSFVEHGSKLPSTPAILRDRLDEFRDSPDHATAVDTARPLLERFMRGESVPTVPALPAVTAGRTGPSEALPAYQTYDARRDPNYNKPADPRAADLVDQLFTFGGTK